MLQAICAVPGVCRWYLTATPLQNRIDDLFTAFVFLRLKPWCEWEQWKQAIKGGNEQGMKRLKV
jgi:hypothetical protein